MHVVVFGLTISSSWGNGHATLWRSLVRALTRRGHQVTFYERDVPYYADTRDLWELSDGARLRLYRSADEIRDEARRELDGADLALSTSFCPDAKIAADLILTSAVEVKAFYDMDTPVTMAALNGSRDVAYLPAEGLSEFDVVFSFTGGRVVGELGTRLGARRVETLYGWVDPEMYRPVSPVDRFQCALSYLGTYAADRQEALTKLFLEPAAMLPTEKFVIGGAQYPADFPWNENIFFTQHLEPSQHAGFFSSCRATLNVTRSAMAEYGYCPSGRLFEAAACGAPLLSDSWEGIETFFAPGEEILLVQSAEQVVEALGETSEGLGRMARAARERTLSEHTADCRVRQLESVCEQVSGSTNRAALAS